MATSGVKSNLPTRGIIRRRGARIGSVSRWRILTSIFVGRGEYQDTITLSRIIIVSISHTYLMIVRKVTTAA